MRIFVILTLCVLTLAGCGNREEPPAGVPNLSTAMPVDPPPGSRMLTSNIFAGDALHKMLLLRMDSGGGILTTSLVSMDDFEETSAFGRLTSQQVGSRIGQYGFRILEARIGAALTFERRNGEFMLTRDACKLLADTYDARAVLVGCYSRAGGRVFVSVRVVRLADNTVLAAYEYFLPRDQDVSTLLGASGRGVSGPAVEGDGVWDRFAARPPAFAAEGGAAAGGASASGADSGRRAATARQEASGVGRRIDPAAPPTPFPGKKK